MVQKHFYRDIDGTLTDMSAYAPRLNWIGQSKAEEGAYGSWTVTLFDPNGELDGSIAPNVIGHRQWFVEDDESEDEDDIIFGGFVGSQTFAREDGTERARLNPKSRVITYDLIDANTWFSKIVLRSSVCKRPVETDVARVQALLASAEAAQIIDTTTFVDTSGAVAMDKTSLRGTYFGQAIADCASASGKNYFLWYRKVAGIRTLTVWYGRDTLADYPSPFWITNDTSVLHGDGVDPAIAEDVWELSADAKFVRSPERQYCGNYATYGDKGAAVYRHSASNHALIASYGAGHRDMVSNWPLVKTKAKAQARADRQLVDVHPQDVRITTSLKNVPSTRVTLAKAGMLIPGIQGTHWGPTGDDWHEARIVSAQPRPHSKGDLYDIDLELVLGADSAGPPGPPYTGDAIAGLQRSYVQEGVTFGTLAYGFSYNPSEAAPGWDTQADAGGCSVDQSGQPFSSITVANSMVGRIYCRASYGGVYFPGRLLQLIVYVNGGAVGTASRFVGPGSSSGSLVVDLRNYPLVAGDVVSVGSGANLAFWTNFGVNETMLLVGRGSYPTISLPTGGPGNYFVGP